MVYLWAKIKALAGLCVLEALGINLVSLLLWLLDMPSRSLVHSPFSRFKARWWTLPTLHYLDLFFCFPLLKTLV